MLFDNDIKNFLNHSIAHVVQSYKNFSASYFDADSENPTKDFSNYHSACKAALAHLDILLKIEKQMIGNGDDVNTKRDEIKKILGMVNHQIRKKDEK